MGRVLAGADIGVLLGTRSRGSRPPLAPAESRHDPPLQEPDLQVLRGGRREEDREGGRAGGREREREGEREGGREGGGGGAPCSASLETIKGWQNW